MFKRGEAQEREQQRAREGQRYGTGKDDEGIAEAFKLRRQHQVDQDAREQERSQELAAFRAQLARFTRIVHGEALRQDLLGIVFQDLERFVERNAGGRITP